MAQGYEFSEKVAKACQKKEALFDESKARYALRSMFAGAFLTMSTAAGAAAAQVIAGLNPALSKFFFAFIFTWGLVYILFLNSELATSNMMYLTAGVYQKNIRLSKAVTILLYCGIFNLIGAMIIGAAFAHSAAFNAMDVQHFIVHLVQGKATRGNGQVLLEAILANIFVNVAILAFLLIKDETAKMWIIISAIFMSQILFLISHGSFLPSFAKLFRSWLGRFQIWHSLLLMSQICLFGSPLPPVS